MKGLDVDWLLVAVSSDLEYLIGLRGKPKERLTLFMLPQQGTPFLIMPDLEASKLEKLDCFFEVKLWKMTEDPFYLSKKLLGNHNVKVAVNDQFWSCFLFKFKRTIPNAVFCPGTEILKPLRMYKDQDEIQVIEKIGEKMDKVFKEVCKLKFIGKTELQIGGEIFEILDFFDLNPEKKGGVASGPNSAFPHHQSNQREIKEGDAIWIELGQGGGLQGYKADKTRVFYAGKPSEEFRKHYNVVRLANEEAFKGIKKGVKCSELDRISRRIIESYGLGSYFTHRLGHGLGLDGHEPPYLVGSCNKEIGEGMVFSIEPGIYFPKKYGIRIEDIIVMSKDGPKNIYSSGHELTIVN